MAVMMMGELWTPVRVAAELECSKAWIYRLMERGELHFIETEAGKFIPRGSLENYRQQRDMKKNAAVAAGQGAM